MVFLNVISFISRTRFPMYTCHTRFLVKKTIGESLNKSVISRSYVSGTKVKVSKPNVNPLSLCISKSQCISYSKKAIFNKKYFITTNLEHFRVFHISERRYLHPVIWAVVRPALKFLAVISGRAFRKWWRELPPNKKKYFLAVIKDNERKIAFFVLTSIILSLMYYVSHIEKTPITGRRRFMAFNSKQLEKINQFQLQQIRTLFQNKILPANHRDTCRVKNVVNRILAANQDIKEMKDKQWDVAIIQSSVQNAFVLPTGYVFVFTGMLSLCSNDDELGTVLAHEIAHCIQNHGAEKTSFTHLLDLIAILVIAAIWAIIPNDSISLLTHWLYQKLIDILLKLPYDRKIETEADAVGLQLAAKACFDVRASSAFWAKMALLHSSAGEEPEVEFLSTHPSHEKRSEYLDSIMNEAINLRSQCGCPKLKCVDPRLNSTRKEWQTAQVKIIVS